MNINASSLKNFLRQHPLLVVIVGLLIIVYFVLFFIFIYLNQQQKNPEKSENGVNVAYYDSEVGETTVDQLRARENFVSEERFKNNLTKFEFESDIHLHPDIYITNDEVVVYEAHKVDPTNPRSQVHLYVADYISEHGSPPLVIEGSWRHGPFMNTYVYPELGFSFVGMPATDEVLEVEYFTPMSMRDYKALFEDQIMQGSEGHEY